jgi:8-oxo-dGTP pyrophosphatase MutT (NUDIX family)
MSDPVAPARAAATALLVRDDPSGRLEVFLVQRHRRSGFLPNAWVFPGGRVEEEDRRRAASLGGGGDALIAGFGLPPVEARAHGVAAIRETFEEAGIRIELDLLRPWSWWVTPEAEPRRYDTRFVLAPVGGDAGGSHDGVETVASQWIRPAAAIALGQSALPLAPPTWWTLRELASCKTVASAVAAHRRADVPVLPIMSFDESGMQITLPPVPGLPDRIALERDGWVAWRGAERLSDPPSPR